MYVPVEIESSEMGLPVVGSIHYRVIWEEFLRNENGGVLKYAAWDKPSIFSALEGLKLNFHRFIPHDS